MYGFRSYERRCAALGPGAHLKRIAIRKVRRDVAVIADRNIGAGLSQMDVISVISEAMRKQPGTEIFAAGHCSKQHGAPPRTQNLSYSTNGAL